MKNIYLEMLPFHITIYVRKSGIYSFLIIFGQIKELLNLKGLRPDITSLMYDTTKQARITRALIEFDNNFVTIQLRPFTRSGVD